MELHWIIKNTILNIEYWPDKDRLIFSLSFPYLQTLSFLIWKQKCCPHHCVVNEGYVRHCVVNGGYVRH